MFDVDGDVKISKGYVLTIDTWENDGDNRTTKTKSFSKLEDARMWVNIAVKYAAQCGNRYGCIYEAFNDGEISFADFGFTDEEIEYIHKSKFFFNMRDVEEANAEIEKLKDPEDDDAFNGFFDGLNSYMYDMDVSGSEDYMGRVIDGWSIHEIPETVEYKRIAFGGQSEYN